VDDNDVFYDGGVMTDEQLKVKEQAIKILYKNFGQDDAIYTCAEEWSKKQVTTAGLVNYYKAYYNQIKESKKVA
tara:strand:+ start:119 stop:340 length:222 start_codon:yes stop_codon:yes gene_type:complete